MKLMKRLICAAVLAALFFIPTATMALGDLKKYFDTQKKPTSVPINGGLVVLIMAGLVLGGKLIYDRTRKSKVKSEGTI